ncbi:MAG: Ig domain-containing protein [Bacteroidales bacterium]|nr:Ig domain-containing protein [Bacteroidales bacterium]MBR1783696.1 Ig domain-containing protein [Bacteroidales bacterium]
MKQIVKLLAGALLLLGLGACGEKTVYVESVKLDKTSLSLMVGDVATLTATVSPSGATNPAVTWASGNTAVATVENGKVTAVAKGVTTVTVTTEDGLKTATCAITVDNVRVSGVSVSPADGAMVKVGETLQLSATVTPDNAYDKSVVWSSDNEPVATVSADGLVTAVSSGIANITATTVDNNKTAKLVITVPGLSLSETAVTVYSGYKASVTATMVPGTASASSLSVASSEETVAVADVAEDGTIQILGIKEGTATITVTATASGLTATCVVTVKDAGGSSFDDDDYGKFE